MVDTELLQDAARREYSQATKAKIASAAKALAAPAEQSK